MSPNMFLFGAEGSHETFHRFSEDTPASKKKNHCSAFPALEDVRPLGGDVTASQKDIIVQKFKGSMELDIILWEISRQRRRETIG
jgi:hypothetical protein